MAIELSGMVGRTVLVQFRAPYCMARRDGNSVMPMGVETKSGSYEYVQVPFLAGELIERDGLYFVRYKDDQRCLIDVTIAEELLAFVTVAPAIEAKASGIIVPE